ncbi:MAG: PKD domain-containing protein [Saprospiraceae bacterium]
MKLLSYIFFCSLLLVYTSCGSDDDQLPNLEQVAAPADLSLQFTIASDNSGLVTILPLGQGVTAYTVFFGDGTEAPVDLAPGQTSTHTYTQGTYPVVLEAMGINGEITTYTQELVVSFRAPENLVVTITPVTGNPLAIDVTATADLATFFEVYFGEDDPDEAVIFMAGETVRHTYAEIGTYDVRVVARSGGPESIDYTETVQISNPLVLPLDFESMTQNYMFANFGGAFSEVVDNPDPSEPNTSSRVAQFTKGAGSEVWAGSFVELGNAIDFSAGDKLRLQTWSPTAGIPILVKIENRDNPDINFEVSVTNTVASGWEELLVDFSAADLTQDYHRVVIFFNFGTAGTGEQYYFDAIEQTDGSVPSSFPLDFEAGSYTFDGFGGAGAEVVDNPDVGAGNPSTKVVAFTKNDGSEVWAGVFTDTDEPISFTSSEKVRMKVWAPVAGITVLMKFENPDNGDDFIEVPVQNTVANTWEELEFTFPGIAASTTYSRIVLFFEFGNNGTGATYYFDDVRLVP